MDFPALGRATFRFPELFSMLDKAEKPLPLLHRNRIHRRGAQGFNEVNQAVLDSACIEKSTAFVL